MEEKKLPEGWIVSTLGEICHVERGITFPAQVKSYRDDAGYIPCLRTANIQGAIDWNNLIFVPESYVKSKDKLLRQEDILISMANSKELVGKVAFVHSFEMRSTFGGFIAAVRSYNSISSKYLFYYLRSNFVQGSLKKSASQTVNIANLSLEGIYSTPVFIPPLSEQQRIVEAIEQQFSCLDEGVALLRQAQKRLKRYRASVLKAAIEGKLTAKWRATHPDLEPASELLQRILVERQAKWEEEQVAKGRELSKVTYKEPDGPDVWRLSELPEGWCWATFEQISQRVTVGYVGPMAHEYIESGVPFLRSQNVRPSRFESKGLKYISLEFHQKIAKSAIHADDILVVRSGSVGVACVMPDLYEKANCSDLVIVKNPAINPHYAAYYMNSTAQNRVRSQQVGIALTHFNTQSMATFPLPFPPLAEQAQIVALVEERLSIIGELEAAIEKALKQAKRMRQSILHRAFSGRLVSQNPEDEPASVLLERIRQEREQEKLEEQARMARPRASKNKKQTSAAQTTWILDGPVEPIEAASMVQEKLWQEIREADVSIVGSNAEDNGMDREREQDAIVQTGKQR